MRLRWVTWWPAPYWRDRFNELSQRPGIDLDVVFLAAAARIHGWKDDPERWNFRYRMVSGRSDRSGYFRVRWRIPNPRSIVKGPFDLVVMPYADLRCMAAAWWCTLTKQPYVLFVPNTPYDRRRQSWIKERTKGWLFRHAAGLFATGSAQRRYALQYHVQPEKVFVIGNPSARGRPAETAQAGAPVAPGPPDDSVTEIVILYVGRLSAEKGLDTLIRATAMLQNLDIRLLLVGSGPEEQGLRMLADDLGVDARFAGFLRGADLENAYQDADVFVLPSVSEPWGLVVNEAMMYALPVVLSDRVGSAPMLLEPGVNGWTFPAGDAAELARRLRMLALDQGLRRRMGDASQRLIERESIPAWADAVCAAATRIGAAHEVPVANPRRQPGSRTS